MKVKESVVFISKCLRNPRAKGAICPSSRFLASAMAREVPNKGKGVVLELGSGVGAVTKALVATKCAKEGALYCVEFDPQLSKHLASNFPSAKVFTESAENIRSILGESAPELSAIVSSLPLLSLPKPMVEKILSEVQDLLPQGARFIQFTYNLRRKPEALGLDKMRFVKSARVFRNVPPARVYVFEKL